MTDRAKWYSWHSLLGLKLALLSCFILITGTFAVVSHEIDWLTNSAMRVNIDSRQTVDWETIYASARRQFPTSRLQSLTIKPDPWFAAEAIYLDANDERFRGFFHPTTGQFQGVGRWFNWQRFFRMTHRHLMMPLPIGITLVCLIGLFLFGSLISGTVIYKNWWKGFFRLPRTRNQKILWGDLHRLFGLWSTWLILVVCMTGIWYLIEQWGGRANYPTVVEAQGDSILFPDSERFSNMLVALGQSRPEMTVSRIRMPTQYQNSVVFEGQGDELLVRDRANNLSFDALTGQLLSERDGDTLSLHSRISEAADPLHFGYFGGLMTKIIYFIFGLMLSALAVTGTWIYALRVSRKRNPDKVKNIWLGMRAGRWISIGILAVCIFNTVYLFRG